MVARLNASKTCFRPPHTYCSACCFTLWSIYMLVVITVISNIYNSVCWYCWNHLDNQIVANHISCFQRSIFGYRYPVFYELTSGQSSNYYVAVLLFIILCKQHCTKFLIMKIIKTDCFRSFNIHIYVLRALLRYKLWHYPQISDTCRNKNVINTFIIYLI